MKRLYLLLLLLIILAMHSVSLTAETINTTKPKVQEPKQLHFEAVPVPQEMKDGIMNSMLAGEGGGTEYWCIFPPNDTIGATAIGMAIFVGSGAIANTPVYLERNGIIVASYTIKDAYDCASFTNLSDARNTVAVPGVWAEFQLPCPQDNEDITYDDQTFENYTWRVFTDPGYEIYVYVASFRNPSSDGYMVLPTDGLGNKYIHCSYQDNWEGDMYRYRTGFACIAVLPDTKINLKLITNFSYCMSMGGKKAGNYTSASLNKGQMWVIANGDARINGGINTSCDFTGSILSSDKNFALISFHQRTGIPVRPMWSRDNLVEQVLPTSKWGNTHVSLQFSGDYQPVWTHPGSGALPGDIFRVVAREMNTTGTATWFFPATLTQLGTWPISLNSEGAWDQYVQYLPEMNPAPYMNTITGACIWRTNKPVQVMQYACTAGYFYSGGNGSDPMMIVLPPVEQWGNNSTFVTGAFAAYNDDHWINLYAEGPYQEDNITPEIDPQKVALMLDSITIRTGGAFGAMEQVTNKDISFLGNRIPNTNYYFAHWKLNKNQVYRIDGRTNLSGSVYGFSSANSYGWPTSMKLVMTNTNDSLPPELPTPIVECNRPYRYDDEGRVLVTLEWIDTTDIDGGQWEDSQIDLGIDKEPRIVFDSTNNLQLERYYYLNDDGTTFKSPTAYWSSGYAYRRGEVVYSIRDPFEDVYAAVRFVDRAGNESTVNIIYIADRLKFYDANGEEVQSINFSVGGLANFTDSVWLTNVREEPVDVNIVEMFMLRNNFTFATEDGVESFVLGPGERKKIYITYSPENTDYLEDILYVNTTCLYFSIPIYASTGLARITLPDYNFGQVYVGSCSTTGNSITITNNGDVDLVITDWYFEPEQDAVNGPFTFEPTGGDWHPTTDNPWIISPGERKIVRTVRYCPSETGDTTARLYFESNADESSDYDSQYKPYAILNGEGIVAGPSLTSYDWGERRVLTNNGPDTVILTNTGNTPLIVRQIGGSWGSPTTTWGTGTTINTLYSADGSYYIPNIDKYIGRIIHPHDSTDIPLDEREMYIEVFFNPQDEYAPYGNPGHPTTDSFYVNFDASNGITNNSTKSYLSGKGYLPKIVPSGYTWTQPTLQNDASAETGHVTIRSTSQTRNLTIKSIRLLDIPNTQPGDFLADDWSLLPDAPITMGDSFVIDVTFKPSGTNPPTRIAYVEIASDAEVGPNEDPTVYDTVKLEAIAYDEGLLATGYDYKEITRCDQPVGQVTVVNMSTTTDMTVYSVEIESAYSHLFTLLTPVDNIVIGPNGNKLFDYQFVPCDWVDEFGNPEEGPITARVSIHTSMGDTIVELIAEPKIIPVTLSLPTIENRMPGEIIDFPINIALRTGANDVFYTFANAGITEVTIVLNAPSRAVQIGNVAPGSSGNNWTWTVTQDRDNNTITLSGKGDALSGAGTLAIPRLQVLLSDLTIIPVTFVSITFNGRECCINSNSIDGSISYDICAQEIRGNINFSGDPFILENITPNPFSATVLPVNYSIGFDANTSIQIYNSQGEVVRTVVNEYLKGGRYNTDVDVSNLSSGAYTIIMKSGPYETTQSLIILR